MFNRCLLLPLGGLFLLGCQTAAVSPGPAAPKGPHATPAVTTPGAAGGQQAIAYLNGQAISWPQLQRPLLEAAGGQVLSELVLERLVRQELTQKRQDLSAAVLDAELARFSSALSAEPDQAAQLLRALRLARGDERFQRTLAINAGLRLLVAPEVQVSPQALQQRFELDHGPRYEARLIVTANAGQAAQCARLAREGKTSFIDLAIGQSTDASKAQGGLLSPISLADATYPAALRQALGKLQVGQVSDPVALDQGFAVLKLERKIAAENVQFDDVKGDLTHRVHGEVEKMLMERRARALLRQAELTILDPALQQSWQKQKEALLQDAQQP